MHERSFSFGSRTCRAYNCSPAECSLCVSGQDDQYVNRGAEMLAMTKSSNPSFLGNLAPHNYDFDLIPRRLPVMVLVAKYHRIENADWLTCTCGLKTTSVSV